MRKDESRCQNCRRPIEPDAEKLQPSYCRECEWQMLQTDAYAAEQAENLLARIVVGMEPVLTVADMERTVGEALERDSETRENESQSTVKAISERIKVLGAIRRAGEVPALPLDADEAEALRECVFEALHKAEIDTARPLDADLDAFHAALIESNARRGYLSELLACAEARVIFPDLKEPALIEVLREGETWLGAVAAEATPIPGNEAATARERDKWLGKLQVCRKLIERVKA